MVRVLDAMEGEPVMRRFIVAAAMAIGLIALWAAILPLAAQPAPNPATSPALSKALFLCRGPHGIDSACAAALAKALVIDQAADHPTAAADRACRTDPQASASVDRRD